MGTAQLRLFALILTSALFWGCAQRPTQIEVDQDLQRQLRGLETWQAEGKLGVRLENEAHSAWFSWRHRPKAFDLRLSGPFGQGTTWLRRNGRKVSLESPDHPVRYATSPEQLMAAELGWQVPVSNLRYWIKGIAAPGLEVKQLSHHPDGTLAELHQQGWQLSYSRYQMVNGWALPGKVVAHHGDIRLTLVIKSWELPEAANRAHL